MVSIHGDLSGSHHMGPGIDLNAIIGAKSHITPVTLHPPIHIESRTTENIDRIF